MSSPLSLLSLLSLLSKLIKNVSNRDKFLKVLQYILKLRLIKDTSGTSGLDKKTVEIMKGLAGVLSLSRLVYRLGDWVDPLHDILEDGPALSLSYAEAVISFFNAIIDDLLCLNKATKGLWPLLSEPLRSSLDLWSSKLWLSSTLINMTILYYKLPQDKLKATADQKLAMAKMMCDVVFCMYDIYGWEWMAEIPIISGIVAASLGLTRSALK